jgi:hypothetical protein
MRDGPKCCGADMEFGTTTLEIDGWIIERPVYRCSRCDYVEELPDEPEPLTEEEWLKVEDRIKGQADVFKALNRLARKYGHDKVKMAARYWIEMRPEPTTKPGRPSEYDPTKLDVWDWMTGSRMARTGERFLTALRHVLVKEGVIASAHGDGENRPVAGTPTAETVVLAVRRAIYRRQEIDRRMREHRSAQNS